MKSSKKSETLEVRISHEDKQALQAKASGEGKTVSHVIRGLISTYLSQPDTRSRPNRLMELIMTLKSKPKSVLAAVLACLALPLTFSSLASAQDVSLLINADYTQPVLENGEEGKRVRRFETEVHMDSDGTATLEYGTLTISIKAETVESGLSLKFTISDDDELIATPSLVTHFDETARIEIGQEQGTMFKLEALPKKL